MPVPPNNSLLPQQFYADTDGAGAIWVGLSKTVTPQGQFKLLDIAADVYSRLLRSGGTMTGPLTLYADPISPMEAATKQYVDSHSGGGGGGAGYLPLTGGTLTGALIMPFGMNMLQFTDTSMSIYQLGTTLWFKAGGHPGLWLTGTNLATDLPLQMNNKNITGMLDPVNPQDAATKAYVDAHAGGGGGGIPEAPTDGNAYLRANSAWTSGGHIAGPLRVTPQTAPLVISANAAALPAANAQVLLQVAGVDASGARIEVDAFGGNPQFTGRRANGTAAAPSAVALNDTLFALNCFGYGATGYAAGVRATFAMCAAEAWNDTAQGTYFQWITTLAGGATSTEKMRLTSTGALLIGATAPVASEHLRVVGGAELDTLNMEAGIHYANLAGFEDSPHKMSFGWNGYNVGMFVDNTQVGLVETVDHAFNTYLSAASGDIRYLGLNGGTLTGPLLLAADPVAALGAATKQYVDAHTSGGSFLPLAGGTLTGPLVLPAGSASATSLNWGTANTGLYGIGSSTVRVAIVGTIQLNITSANIVSAVPFNASFGSAATPGLSVGAAANTGLFGTTTTLGLAVAGTQRLLIDNTAGLITSNFPIARPGVVNASDAVAGNEGEFISAQVAVGSALALTNNAALTITSITLTPGDWDVRAMVGFSLNAATVPVYFVGGTALSAANVNPQGPSGGARFFQWTWQSAGLTEWDIPVPTTRINVSASTTVYLCAQASFNTNSAAAFGWIAARRVR